MPTQELNLPCIFRPASRLLPLYQRAPKLGFLPPRVQNCCSFSSFLSSFENAVLHVSPLPVKASMQLNPCSALQARAGAQPPAAASALAPKVGLLRQRLRNSVAASAPKNLPFYRVWKLLLTPLPNGVGKAVCCLWFRSTPLARPCKSFAIIGSTGRACPHYLKPSTSPLLFPTLVLHRPTSKPCQASFQGVGGTRVQPSYYF